MCRAEGVLLEGDHTPQLEGCGPVSTRLDPGANNAAVVVRGATADGLDVATLPRISQPIVGDVGRWEVGRPVEDGDLVVGLAPVGAGKPVHQ